VLESSSIKVTSIPFSLAATAAANPAPPPPTITIWVSIISEFTIPSYEQIMVYSLSSKTEIWKKGSFYMVKKWKYQVMISLESNNILFYFLGNRDPLDLPSIYNFRSREGLLSGGFSKIPMIFTGNS
jgi:hypothetical protein